MLLRCTLSLAALLGLTLPANPQALPGQVVRDPHNPQWLVREGGERIFLAGPGDPEDFLYRGNRLPDGTRDGDQLQLIATLAEHGGNTLYVQAVRSHGGDGESDHNPFVDSQPSKGLDADILAQWDEWFAAAHEAGIVIFFFYYDDSAAIWDGFGGQVEPAEAQFVTALTDHLEKHPNLILIVSEESEEARSAEHARDLAQLIADADDHHHLIGDHHHSGTQFKSWAEGSAMQVFGMQRNVTGDEVHMDAATVFEKGVAAGAEGHAWMAVYLEAAVTLAAGTTARRHFMWDAAMGGLQPLIYGMDIASTPVEQLEQARHLQQFMEQSDVWCMQPADERAAGNTRWVLANDHGSAILYSRATGAALALADMQDETLDLLWLDTVTGHTVSQERVQVPAGTNSFARPEGIGQEAALWLRRSWADTGVAAAVAGKFGQPALKITGAVGDDAPLSVELQNAHPQSIARLFVGSTAVSIPTHGGVLVPAPQGEAKFATGPTGTITLHGVWPAGIPSNLSFFAQVWVLDPGGPAGWAATNAVVEVTP